MLELLLINASELTGEIRIGGCMSCSDHAMVEAYLLGKEQIKMLAAWKANFQLFRELEKKLPENLPSKTSELS